VHAIVLLLEGIAHEHRVHEMVVRKIGELPRCGRSDTTTKVSAIQPDSTCYFINLHAKQMEDSLNLKSRGWLLQPSMRIAAAKCRRIKNPCSSSLKITLSRQTRIRRSLFENV
jgi:hypothetical protein